MVGSEEALLPVTPSEARSPAPAGQKHCQVLTREGRTVSDPPAPHPPPGATLSALLLHFYHPDSLGVKPSGSLHLVGTQQWALGVVLLPLPVDSV